MNQKQRCQRIPTTRMGIKDQRERKRAQDKLWAEFVRRGESSGKAGWWEKEEMVSRSWVMKLLRNGSSPSNDQFSRQEGRKLSLIGPRSSDS